MRKRHVVLVGLPGSGKSTVGRLVAAALGAPFADADAEVERLAGKSIGRIFLEDGEAAFRALEARCVQEILRGAPAVVATGGGFLEDPGNRDAVRTGGLAVYLATRAPTAAERLAGIGGRPLLERDEPAVVLAALLGRREAGYLAADHVVPTDGLSAETVAAAVVSLARDHAGW